MRPSAVPCGRGGVLPQLLVAGLSAGYAAGAVFGWGTRPVALVMGDFGLAGAALAATVSCLLYSRTLSGLDRPAWALFAAASAMLAAGNSVWGWYEVVLGRAMPVTSLADVCFLLFAPTAIIGLLVLAKRPVTRAGWACLGLDAWLIGGSLLTISWSLALAHATELQGGSTVRSALILAYPMLDIVLVSMVLALHFRRPAGDRSSFNTAFAGLALTVLCDTLFISPTLRSQYHSGQLLDAGWFAGSLLLAYAPWAGRREEGCGRADGPHRETAGPPAALTPYLAAVVCTLGILYSVLDGGKADRVVLVTGCTVMLALVARQGIVLLANNALTKELAQTENHFRSLVQGSSDVIMIVAPTGVLCYVSPAARGVYGRGAEDMIGTELSSHLHPEDLGRVLHGVRRFLAAPPGNESATRIECRIRCGDGSWLNIESSVNRHQDGLIFNSRDVTERVRLQAQLQHNASHDPLTDLPNRSLFTERVGQALEGRRADDGHAAVLFIDLDGFKAVNDTAGHQAGDELLIQAARRLHASVRSGDMAARLGGDEFAALFRGGGGDRSDRSDREYHIHEVADRLRVALSEPYRVDGTELRVAASIGVAFAEPGITPSELMRNADLAMYRAKQAGKGRVEMYAPQMQADVVRRTELAARLRTALQDGEFTLLHQPVVNLATGRIDAVEAQARWRSTQGILFTPAEFLRLAEDTDRTAELSRWLLREAVAQAVLRHGAGQPVPVAVRLSARRLMHRDLPLGSVEAILTDNALPPGSLILEVTDSDPLVPLDDLEHRLTALRRLGVRIALDGFGSGCTGLTALRRLPVDILKLDRAFTEGVVESARLHKITGGLLRITGDLGLMTVADGVDRPEQLLALRSMGCTHGQGMAFSGPLDEQRLRGSLTRGSYPVPLVPIALTGGLLPARRTSTEDGVRSNSETPVPPA